MKKFLLSLATAALLIGTPAVSQAEAYGRRHWREYNYYPPHGVYGAYYAGRGYVYTPPLYFDGPAYYYPSYYWRAYRW